jgi:hypothetical protein
MTPFEPPPLSLFPLPAFEDPGRKSKKENLPAGDGNANGADEGHATHSPGGGIRRYGFSLHCRIPPRSEHGKRSGDLSRAQRAGAPDDFLFVLRQEVEGNAWRCRVPVTERSGVLEDSGPAYGATPKHGERHEDKMIVRSL